MGLLTLGIAAALTAPAMAGDFDVSTSNSTVHHAPPPPTIRPRPSPPFAAAPIFLAAAGIGCPNDYWPHDLANTRMTRDNSNCH